MKKITFLTTPSACGRHPFNKLKGNYSLNILTVLRSYALTVFFLLGLLPFSLQAQVTIGKNQAPQSYSVLELVAQYKSGEYGGFRLPQLTTAQRDALGVTAADIECRGLMIYNLTSDCIETWNGRKWFSFCEGTEFITSCVVNGEGGTKLRFMNYNLGAADVVKNMTAAQQAAHTNAADTYGDLYQWGRMADGHEKRNSPVIAGPVSALDANGQPTGTSIGRFITVTADLYDWRTPQNNSLWGVPKTIQDPCPAGWRVPTVAEWQAVLDNNAWTWQDSPVSGRKISPDGGSTTTLFLPAAGNRNPNTGVVLHSGDYGYYWSSTVFGFSARFLRLNSGDVVYGTYRAAGVSVRCVADL